MRYFLPRGEQIEELSIKTKEFFHAQQIDVSGISKQIYEDIYHGIISDSIYLSSNWRNIKEEVINETLIKVEHERRTIETNRRYIDILPLSDEENLLNLSIYRFLVQLENITGITHVNLVDEHNEPTHHPLRELMDAYYNCVIDDIVIETKELIRSLIGSESWNIYDIIDHNRNTEMVNYGDFRIHAFDVLQLHQ